MTVDVEPTYTIAKIKELLEEKEGIPVREYADQNRRQMKHSCLSWSVINEFSLH